MSDKEIVQNYLTAYARYLVCPDSELEKAEAELLKKLKAAGYA